MDKREHTHKTIRPVSDQISALQKNGTLLDTAEGERELTVAGSSVGYGEVEKRLHSQETLVARGTQVTVAERAFQSAVIVVCYPNNRLS